MFKRLKALFRKPRPAPLAVAIVPDSEPPAPRALSVETVGQYGDRHTVRRQYDGSTWDLYDGPNGARARGWFEHVKREREPGTMEYWYNGVRRDWWPR